MHRSTTSRFRFSDPDRFSLLFSSVYAHFIGGEERQFRFRTQHALTVYNAIHHSSDQRPFGCSGNLELRDQKNHQPTTWVDSSSIHYCANFVARVTNYLIAKEILKITLVCFFGPSYKQRVSHGFMRDAITTLLNAGKHKIIYIHLVVMTIQLPVQNMSIRAPQKSDQIESYCWQPRPATLVQLKSPKVTVTGVVYMS